MLKLHVTTEESFADLPSRKITNPSDQEINMINRIVQTNTIFESQYTKVWFNVEYGKPSYYLCASLYRNGSICYDSIYFLTQADINEYMEIMTSYYRRLNIDIFEILIHENLNIDNMISRIRWRYDI